MNTNTLNKIFLNTLQEIHKSGDNILLYDSILKQLINHGASLTTLYDPKTKEPSFWKFQSNPNIMEYLLNNNSKLSKITFQNKLLIEHFSDIISIDTLSVFLNHFKEPLTNKSLINFLNNSNKEARDFLISNYDISKHFTDQTSTIKILNSHGFNCISNIGNLPQILNSYFKENPSIILELNLETLINYGNSIYDFNYQDKFGNTIFHKILLNLNKSHKEILSLHKELENLYTEKKEIDINEYFKYYTDKTYNQNSYAYGYDEQLIQSKWIIETHKAEDEYLKNKHIDIEEKIEKLTKNLIKESFFTISKICHLHGKYDISFNIPNNKSATTQSLINDFWTLLKKEYKEEIKDIKNKKEITALEFEINLISAEKQQPTNNKRITI